MIRNAFLGTFRAILSDRSALLLLIGSAEPGRFSPAQGTDLLRFFGQVFRLVLMGWLRE